MFTRAQQAMKWVAVTLGMAVGLSAQVDTRLLPANNTDILDVYRSGGAKPEMLMVFDMSGSMSAMFWHQNYWTNVTQTTHQTSSGDNTDGLYIDSVTRKVYLRPTVTRSGSSGSYTYTVSSLMLSMDNGQLVKANGDLVTTADVPPTPTIRDWVMAATHVRMTATNSASVKRTLDLPIPWKLFQPYTVDVLGNRSYNTTMISDFVKDPASGQNVEFEKIYATASTITNTSNPDNITYLGNTNLVRIGTYFDYNRDYITWLFFGTKVRSTDGNSEGLPGTGTYPAAVFPTVPTYKDDSGTKSGYIIPGSTATAGNAKAFTNAIPPGTRYQFLKRAVLSTWFANQDRVWWAYRFLAPSGEVKTSISPAQGTAYTEQRGLTLLKKSTSSTLDPSVTFLQTRVPGDNTPLTLALANAYAQLTVPDSASSIFDAASTGMNPESCRDTYVVLFTDGNANDGPGGNGSYLNTTNNLLLTSESDFTGGKVGKAGSTTLYVNGALNVDGAAFNIWSLAGVAAHGDGGGSNGGSNANDGSTSGAVASFAPFKVTSRGADATHPRRITTMTVGLSLAGNTADASGGKGPLLRAAAYGDPKLKGWDVAKSVAYGVSVANTNSVNFFDATNPDTLTDNLGAILDRVTSANTSIVAPSAPLVGINIGNRAYLGRFQTQDGPAWTGDLLMTGVTIKSDGAVAIVDKGGVVDPGNLTEDNAIASASAALDPLKGGRNWKERKVYTMVPGTTIPVGGLPLTTDVKQLFDETNGALTATVMGTVDSASARALIRFLKGASTAAQLDANTPTTNTSIRRNANAKSLVMGDIIGSSPSALEFDESFLPSGALSSAWGSYSTFNDRHFRMIFVGDNLGHFHAFGEVSAIDPGTGQLSAVMDEVWSFIPSAFLNKATGPATPKLSFLLNASHDHEYLVDGSPFIYFEDKDKNRKVTAGDTVRVVLGLGKGGRSYYAFDVADPRTPLLKWTVDPDNDTSSYAATISAMGLSTATPAVARVETGTLNDVTDLVFLGGGYSNLAVDTAFGKKLGRSILALNIKTGDIVKVYDFIKNASLASVVPDMGAISAGVFPFSFYTGSFKAQRVYFADLSGGVYALGSNQIGAPAPNGFRMDYSNIDQWTTDGSPEPGVEPTKPGIRWIYKGLKTLKSGNMDSGQPISTTPTAFRVSRTIPQFRRDSGMSYSPNMVPAVVGVTFVTGDKNDPMDNDGINPTATNTNRLVMVFDRQDSSDLPNLGNVDGKVGGANATSDTTLADLTGVTVVGDTSYLGTNSLVGYQLKFTHNPKDTVVTTKTLYEKGLLSPIVLSNGLVFSSFRPGGKTTTACQGAGTTYTFRMCDVLSPVFANGDATANLSATSKTDVTCNGSVFTWTNLAGDLTSVGSRLVIQSGQTEVPGDPNKKGILTRGLQVPGGINTFAPRSWRIIR